jgi:transcriptional regulator with XRE-family HTH domain
LADAAGTSEEWIRKLERGVRAPSLATLDSVSRGLGVTVAALFAGADANRDRFETLVAEAEGLSDDQLAWIEAAVRLMRKMPR